MNNINGNIRSIKAMTKQLGPILGIFGVVVFFATAGLFGIVQAATLDDISYSVLPGERVQLKIELSEAMQGEPLSFTIDNPARIALDFPNTSLGGVEKNQSIDVGVAHSVSAVEASSSGAATVSFKKAVLSLRVTPQITPDDKILLDLQVNQDTQGAVVAGGIPTINTRNVGTQVMVDNGETVVLGGVYSQSDNTSSDRIPFFGDLPYLGFLFKRTSESTNKSELLIFVTPKILKDSLNI
jgi:type IV pilus assembly protein PilQ